MTYTKQEWIDGETVISAERMGHIEDAVAALSSKTAVSYALNTMPTIPPGGGNSSTIPTGWEVLGEQVPAITYMGADGFRINTPGVYTIALSGSFNGSGSGNMEYRVDHNGTRVLAIFGSGGDVSSRSGVCVITAGAGDLITPNYAHGNSTDMQLRRNSFNTISFVQIA